MMTEDQLRVWRNRYYEVLLSVSPSVPEIGWRPFSDIQRAVAQMYGDDAYLDRCDLSDPRYEMTTQGVMQIREVRDTPWPHEMQLYRSDFAVLVALAYAKHEYGQASLTMTQLKEMLDERIVSISSPSDIQKIKWIHNPDQRRYELLIYRFELLIAPTDPIHVSVYEAKRGYPPPRLTTLLYEVSACGLKSLVTRYDTPKEARIAELHKRVAKLESQLRAIEQED